MRAELRVSAIVLITVFMLSIIQVYSEVVHSQTTESVKDLVILTSLGHDTNFIVGASIDIMCLGKQINVTSANSPDIKAGPSKVQFTPQEEGTYTAVCGDETETIYVRGFGGQEPIEEAKMPQGLEGSDTGSDIFDSIAPDAASALVQANSFANTALSAKKFKTSPSKYQDIQRDFPGGLVKVIKTPADTEGRNLDFHRSRGDANDAVTGFEIKPIGPLSGRDSAGKALIETAIGKNFVLSAYNTSFELMNHESSPVSQKMSYRIYNNASKDKSYIALGSDGTIISLRVWHEATIRGIRENKNETAYPGDVRSDFADASVLEYVSLAYDGQMGYSGNYTIVGYPYNETYSATEYIADTPRLVYLTENFTQAWGNGSLDFIKSALAAGGVIPDISVLDSDVLPEDGQRVYIYEVPHLSGSWEYIEYETDNSPSKFLAFDPAGAAWWNETWTHRQAINISNPGDENLTSFQIPLFLNLTNVGTNFNWSSEQNAVRFTYWNESAANETYIDYWIENWSPTDKTARVWVNVTYIPSNTTSVGIGNGNSLIYMYYGNPSASSQSDGYKVFIFFDEFTGTSLNTTKWTATSAGSVTVNNSYATITSGSLYTKTNISTNPQNRIFEAKINYSTLSPSYSGLCIANSNITQGSNSGSNALAYIMTQSGTTTQMTLWGANGAAASYNLVSGTVIDGGLETAREYLVGFEFMGSSQLSFFEKETSNYTDIARMTYSGTWTQTYWLWLGYFTGAASGATDIDDISADWVRVRKYSSGTPAVSLQTEEPAEMVNITIDQPAQNSVKTRLQPFTMNGTVNCTRGTCTNVSAYAQYLTVQSPIYTWAESSTADFNTYGQSTNISTADGSISIETSNTGDPWWNTSWIYRQPYNISNTAGNLTNFQVLISLNASRVGANFNWATDINATRFIWYNSSSGQSTKCPFWIENWSTSSSNATIWVEVPFLLNATNTTINMYYGNNLSQNESSGVDTFNFFDEFSGSELDSKWSVGANDYSVSNGVFRINVGAVTLASPLSFNLNEGYILESRMLYNNLQSAYSGTLSAQSSQYTQGSNGGSDATNLYMRESGSRSVSRWTGSGSAASYSCGSGSVWASSDNVWYLMGGEFNSSGVRLTRNRLTMGTYGCGWVKSLRYISLGYFSGGAANNCQDTSYDWVLVRKWARVAPTNINGAQQTLNIKPQAVYVSSVFDTGSSDAKYYNISWNSSIGSNTSLSVYTRTSSDNATWTSWFTQTNSSQVYADNNRYIQYKVEMNTTNTSQTPYIDDMAIQYKLSTLAWTNMSSGAALAAINPYSCGSLNSTNRTCNASWMVTPGVVGQYSVRIKVNPESEERNITVYAVTYVSNFSTNQSPVGRGGTVQLSARLFDDLSQPMQGKTIYFYDDSSSQINVYDYSAYPASKTAGHLAYFSRNAGAIPPSTGPTVQNEIAFTDANYSGINASENSYINTSSNTQKTYRFSFNITDTLPDIDWISFRWEGKQSLSDNVYVVLWNYNASTWDLINQSAVGASDVNLTYNLTENFGDYINDSVLHLLIESNDPFGAEYLYTDFVSASVSSRFVIGQATTDADGYAYKNYTVPSSSPLGTHTLNASFNGSQSEYLYSSYQTTGIEVTSVPQIADVLAFPSMVGFGYNVTIQANVTDEQGIDKVYAFVSYPNGTQASLLMANNSSSTYLVNFTDTWLTGTYEYFIRANNTKGTYNSSSNGQFFVNVSAQAKVATEKSEYKLGETVYLGSIANGWWNSSWDYRMPITITDTTGENLASQQINFTIDTQALIAAGKMNLTCRDMRFTNSTGSAIGHWIQNESLCNTNETMVWVNVPYIPASGDEIIYMYYGNPSVQNATNFSAVFTKSYTSSGLVGEWHLDEGSGTNAFDSSGNGYTGILRNGAITCCNPPTAGCPTWQPTDGAKWDGRSDINGSYSTYFSGSYLTFDGSNDRVVVPGFTALDSKSQFSAEMWVRQDSNSQGQYVLWRDGNVLIEFGSSQAPIGDTNIRLRMNLDGNWRLSHIASGILDTGTWHHWVFTFDGDNLTMYKDSVQVYTSNADASYNAFTAGTGDLQIGTRDNSELDGQMDEVRLYNTSLSADEVKALYENRKYLPTAPTTTQMPEEDKSVGITNPGDYSFRGYLWMVVQSNNTGSWLTKQIIVDDVATSTQRTVSNKTSLNLTQIWNSKGGWYTDEEDAGAYRVYAELRDHYGNYLLDNEGVRINASGTFTIPKAALNLTNLTHENQYDYEINEYEVGDNISWINVTVLAYNNSAVSANITLSLLNASKSSLGWGPSETKSCGSISENQTCQQMWDNSSFGYQIPLSASAGDYTFYWNVSMVLKNGNASFNDSFSFRILNLSTGFNANLSPNRIYKPSWAGYNFTLNNTWSGNITDVYVRINCPAVDGMNCSCKLTGQSGSTCLLNVTALTAAVIPFNISVNDSTPLGDYDINVTLNYTNPGQEIKSWGNIQNKILQVRSPNLLDIALYSVPDEVTRNYGYNLSVYANNTASFPSDNVWLNYTLPAGWSNSSGEASKYTISLCAGCLLWNNISANVSINSAIGPNQVRVDSASLEGQEDWAIKTLYVYANTTTTDYSPNLTIPNRGDTILLSATLSYDNGTKVSGAVFDFWDQTGNGTAYYIGQATTNSAGVAQRIYIIPMDALLGAHNLNATHSGSSSVYTRSSSNITVITVHARPDITGILAAPQTQGYRQNVSLQANVTDGDDGVDKVYVNVTYPNSSSVKLQMVNLTADIYKINFTDTWSYGTYVYYILANDTIGSLSQSSLNYFYIGANGSMYVETMNDSYDPNQYVNLTGETTGNWWDLSWKYRFKINITNTAGNLSDFQVNFTVNATDAPGMNWTADQNSIRFVWHNASANQNMIVGHWVQNWSTSGQNAAIWIKAPFLQNSTNTTIYMYYGNNLSANTSDFSEVFTKSYGTTGLAAEWHMDEGAGATAYDSSGNSYNATLYGPEWLGSDGGQWDSRSDVSFSSGDSLDFGGTEYANVLGFTELDGQANFSAEMWVRQDSNSQGQYVLWRDGNVLIEFGSSQAPIGDTNIRLRMNLDGNWRLSHIASGILDTGTWHHWVFTFDGDNLTMYKDSVQVYTSNADASYNAFTAGTGDLQIGRRDANYLDGQIDEVRIYNRTLSAAEIKTHYERRLYAPAVPVVYKINEAMRGSSVTNSGNFTFDGFLLMLVQMNTTGGWQYVATIINDTATSTVRTINATSTLDMGAIWNSVSWYTNQQLDGVYRAYVALTDPNGNVLNSSSGWLNATYNFNLTPSKTQVNITQIRIYNVTGNPNRHTYTGDIKGSGVNRTFNLLSGSEYRIEIDVNNLPTSSNWHINQTNLSYIGLNSSWAISPASDVWYSNSSDRLDGNFTGGNWSGGVVSWNTTRNGIIYPGGNVTFYYIVNITTNSSESYQVNFRINETSFLKNDYSIYKIILPDYIAPWIFGGIYNLTRDNVTRGNSLTIFGRWNELIYNATAEYNSTSAVFFNYTVTLPSPNLQNWTNYTISTTSLWPLGKQSAKIYASDEQGNWNTTQEYLNYTVYGIARVTSGSLNASIINISTTVLISCLVNDYTTTTPIQNYYVAFYNSTGLIGVNSTNATGWSSLVYTGNKIGLDNLTCNITQNLTQYYVIDTNNFKSFNLTIRESEAPLYASNGPANGTLVHKNESTLLYSYWTDNYLLGFGLIATNETGAWANKTVYGSPMALSGKESWSNFTWSNLTFSPGLMYWRIYANDSFSNANATDIKWLDVWGWSELSDITLSPQYMYVTNSTTVACRVRDANSQQGIGGYTVSFYNATGLIGMNTTNSTGWAVFKYTDLSSGIENMTCNITSNSTLKYNVTANSSAIKYLHAANLGEDVEPPAIIGGDYSLNATAINKTESVLAYAWWNEVIANATINYNSTGTTIDTYQISQPYTGNWTNYTISTTSAWAVGEHVVKIEATDSYDNWNTSLAYLNLDVYGRAKPAWYGPNGTVDRGIISFYCKVSDKDSAQPIGGYTVYFYGSDPVDPYLGSNLTDSSGIARFTINASSYTPGAQGFSCMIDTDLDKYYHVLSADRRSSATLTIMGYLNASIISPVNQSSYWKWDTIAFNSTTADELGASVTPDIALWYNSTGQIASGQNTTWQIPLWVQVGPQIIRFQETKQYYHSDSKNSTIYIWGWSKAANKSLSPTAINSGGSANFGCQIVDANSSQPISGYRVYFYNSTGLIGVNTTSASGWAYWRYVDAKGSAENLTCNITANATLYYNASLPDSLNLTILIDNNPPQIENETRIHNEIIHTNERINVTVDASDINLNTVWVRLGRPQTSDYINVTMSQKSGNTYNLTSAAYSNQRGVWNATFYANDSAGNMNQTTTALNWTVWGWSEVSWTSPNGGEFQNYEDVPLICRVTDSNTSSGVQNYPVDFYVNGTYLSTQLTNSSGYATYTWNTNSFLGSITMSCNITSNYTVYYNATNKNSGNTTIAIDTSAPHVENETRNHAEIIHTNEMVNITVDVSDANINTVWVRLGRPQTSDYLNVTITNITASRYSLMSVGYSNQRGVWNATFYANDSAGNLNSSATALNWTVWGWSRVGWVSPLNSFYKQNTNVTLRCRVTDSNTSVGVQSYTVYFYRNGTYLGANATDSSGYANYYWNTGSLTGTFNMTCNITDNSTMYYNKSANYEANTSMTIDFTNPIIENETRIHNEIIHTNERINVTVDASDINLNTVWVRLGRPQTSDYINVTMSQKSGNTYNLTSAAYSNQRGVWNATFYANDSAGNMNQTTTALNWTVWGWSRIAMISPSGGNYSQNANIVINCRVTDSNLSTGIQNYIVYFYKNGTYLGANATDSSGYSSFVWNTTTSLGQINLTCNITDNSTMLYHRSSLYEANTTIQIDNFGPIVENETRMHSAIIHTNEYINMTVDASDNTLSSVWVRLGRPQTSDYINVTMSPKSGNTYSIASTSYSYQRGMWSATFYANDTAGNLNQSATTLNWTVWGWADASWASPTTANASLGTVVNLVCRAIDGNTSGGVQNYPIKFYYKNSTESSYHSLGTSLTNSSGYAAYSWNTAGLDIGSYTLLCNLTHNATIYYNATPSNAANKTLDLIESLGYLEVSLVIPPSIPGYGEATLDTGYKVGRNRTFVVTANTTCRGGNCGTVQGTLRYNSSGGEPNSAVASTSGTPLYIVDLPAQNPQSCGNLNENQSCILNWTINATGNLNSVWTIDALFDATQTASNDTANAPIQISIVLIMSLSTYDLSATADPDITVQKVLMDGSPIYIALNNNSNDAEGLYVKGTNLTGPAGYNMSVSNMSYYTANLPGFSIPVKESYQSIISSAPAGTNQSSYYWINTPQGVTSGAYTGFIYIMANATS